MRVVNPRVTHPFATLSQRNLASHISPGSRSTCMLKTRRQRSFWARIKPFVIDYLVLIILIRPDKSDPCYNQESRELSSYHCYLYFKEQDSAIKNLEQRPLLYTPYLKVPFIKQTKYNFLQLQSQVFCLFSIEKFLRFQPSKYTLRNLVYLP